MSTSSLKDELKRAMLGAHVKLNDDMLSKCLSLAQEYNISAETFVLHWEAHSINVGADSLNTTNFSSFRAALLKEVTPPETVTPTPKAVVVSRPSMAKRSTVKIETPSPNKKLKDGQLEQIISTAQSSPLKNENSQVTAVSSALVTPNMKNEYENRKNIGQVIVSYNPSNLKPLKPNTVRSSVIEVMEPSLTKPYKYMTDKPIHYALNDRIEDMSVAILQQYLKSTKENVNFNEENENSEDIFEQVGVPRQSIQFNVGRICNESHSGKMNSTTILLEGSRTGSNGARIAVDVSNLDNYSLFPGQIVGVKGMNLSGRKIVAEEIVEGIDYINGENLARTKKSLLKEMHSNISGTRIFSVAGPYTSDDLEYKPLESLFEKVVEEKPDVVIMMGPFVDMRMDKIANGEMTVEFMDEDGNPDEKIVSYEAFFAAKISIALENLYEELKDDLKTQFVLVPSTDDAIAEPVFPQPPLQDTLPNDGKVIEQIPETELFPFGSLCLDRIEIAGGNKRSVKTVDRRVHLVANPATIRVNEITIGITSNDAFFQLSCEETNSKLPVGTRLSRLAQHFLKQQSYYPIFPAPVIGGCDLNLDVTQQDSYSIPFQPDILLLPSRLTPLVMDISNGTTVINPGHLMKGSSPGSYASMDILPMKTEELESADEDKELTHGVRERIRVEVRRI